MYFNRKNAAQKNWRMIKKGKHFLFGCSLVFAVGASLATQTVHAETASESTVESGSKAEEPKPGYGGETGTYEAPATVATQPVAVKDAVVAEKPTVKVVNKEALTKLVEEVKGLDKTGKTEDSLSRLNTALEQAQKVLTNAEASQDQVDAAVASLKIEEKTVAAKENAEATEDKAVPTDETTETSATQPKLRSRRAAGQERAQDRSAEGKNINFEYRSRKKIEDGDPTQRAKIEYRQLGDYEVADGKTVATDPEGKGRPVLEWTVTFNEAQYDLMGGYYYFTIPKNVSEPYKVVTEYNNGAYSPRDGWVDGNVTSGGSPSAEGQQFIDAGSKLNWRVGNTVGNINSVPGLSGVMDQTEKVYVLGFANNTKARKVTIKYRTVVTDPSQAISYIAGVDSKTGAPRNNWYGLTGKYDKHLVSQVDAPKVTPNLTNTSVNVPIQTVASTSSTLSGTGVPGAKIKLYIDGQEQNIGNVTVDSAGNWTTGELPTALNNNQGDGTTIKPRQTVEVSQVVKGEESSRRTVPVSVGETTVEPSSLTTNKDAVVAGQKEVTLKVPHDAGIAYMRYTNTAGETVEIPVKRDSLSAAWTSEKSDKATVKKVENGKFQDTIFLTMADKIAGTKVEAISNVVEGGFSSVADWQPRSVENQAPTIASAVEGNRKTVTQDAQLDLASLVTVADKEDDKQATLGDKVHAEVVSVNGDTETKTVDTNTPGTYTVRYKAVDSQGLGSNEIEVTVVVNPARQNEAPTVSIQYSDPKPSLKEVYLYNGEEADVDITFNDDSGKIKSAALKKGGNQALNNIDGNPDKQDNEFGYTVTAINSETATPAKIKVTGQVSGIAADKLPKTESDSLKLVTRFATATDTDGAFIVNDANRKEDPVTKEAVGTYLTDPGAVTFVLKAQTKKYDIKTPASADKVTVSDANNVTDKEFKEIKAKVKLEYSQNNPDARLADKKGTEVENQDERIESITREGKNVVVTYKDGSKDTKALADFVNVAPKVELPYSNQTDKQIYVYTGENTDLTFKGTDEKEIKDLYLRGPGDISWNNADNYGFTTGKVENGAVKNGAVTGEGSVSDDKKTATIKMTGVTTLTAPNHWTSFVVSKDNDGKLSNTDYRALDKDPNARQKPGYVQFIVKNQTSKYDIATPTEKVEVADPANVTKDDLAKIEKKLKLEYSNNNDDANFAGKKGKTVDAEDAKTKIKSVTKDNAGNLVVTYTDGSTDTKPLSEFVTKAKPTQPKITTDLTGKAGTKTPVEVTAEPGTKVELFDKDGKKIGEGTADNNGKVTITPTVDIPAGNVTAKATKDGQTSDASAPKVATAATPGTTAPAKPVVDTDLTGKAGTKTPVEVTAEPGTKVELFDKDGKKIGEATAGTDGKATITPTVDIPAGPVTAKVTKDGQTSDASAPKVATAATPGTTAPAKPVVDTDLTGKAGTKTPVEVTAEPGTKVELFDKDGKKIGEGTADTNGKVTITPTVDIPAGNVTAKATDPSGKVSDPSEAAKATTPDTDAGKNKVTDPTVTPVTDPSNLTDAEKAKVADEVKKSNPTVSKVEVGNDGTTTVTYPDGTTAVIPADKTVKKSADKAVKDPTVTPVTDPSNLTDAEKAKVTDEVKKSNPTVSKVEVGNDGTTTVTYPDGTTAVIPADKTVKKSADKVVTDPSVTPVTDPSNLTDAEKTKVAEEVKKANPTVSKVEVGNDGTTTVTYPDGTTAVIPADKTVKKSADKAVKDPTVTPVTDPSNLTDAEKVKVADEVKKSNPTVTDVKVDKDGTTTVTYPDGTPAVIPADKTVKKSVDKGTKDPSVTPVTDPSNLTDAEKAKVADEVKKANPTVSKVEVGNDGTTTVTYPDGTPAVIPADKTVKKSADKAVKDPTVTPVTDPSNLTDAEKAKVADEVKKSNPTVSKVEVGNDGTTTVTYPDGTTAVIPSDKTVKKSADKAVKDPSVTPVTDPSNLTDAEKAKVADEVKKSNPTVSKVEVGNDGTTTVTYPDGTTAVIPADKTVKKSADKVVTDPSVTPVTDPSNLTDAEKAKVADEVKKSNPTVSKVEVGNDGTTTVTYPDGTTAVIPADKTVKKSADKAVKDPTVTPVTDPSNLTDAEKAKVADEVKKSNPTVSKVEVGNDGTTTVTYPDGTTAVIPSDKTVKKSADKAIKDPSVTPVTDPSNLTDAEKAKVADEVKKSNPTVSKVEVGNDGTTTVTYPDGTTAVIPADKTVKKSADKAVKDPSVTPVADPSNLTDAEKAKVTDEVKKSNPTVSKVEVGNDGTTTVTYPDGTTAVIPADKTVKKSADKAVKDPSVTPVADPSNLTDAEKAKVADEVKKSNPTVSKVEVGNDGTTTVTYPDGTTAVIPADKTVKKSADKVVTNPSVTPVIDPSNLTDAEKAKVADEVKKANPTAKDIKVNKDGSVVVTFEDGTTAVIPADKTVKKSSDKVKESDGVKNPSVTPVTDPSNLTDAEKAKVADEVKKANPTAKDIKVNNDGSVVVTFEDGSVAVIPAEKSVTAANQDSPAQAPAKKAGAKELPNTGTEQSSASLALALLAAATGGLLFAKKREEEE